MGKAIDITGQKFERLTATKLIDMPDKNGAYWECKCDCGKTIITRGNRLRMGDVKSCGCIRKKHGMTGTLLYKKWVSIKYRCNNPHCTDYMNYGGRGIKVCKEWEESFDSFQKWAYESGYSDGLTIERIDCDKDYCPENCKWIPMPDQAKNRRMCLMFTYNGKTQNLKQWCDDLGLNYKSTHQRIYKLNWSFEKAISTPKIRGSLPRKHILDKC